MLKGKHKTTENQTKQKLKNTVQRDKASLRTRLSYNTDFAIIQQGIHKMYDYYAKGSHEKSRQHDGKCK